MDMFMYICGAHLFLPCGGNFERHNFIEGETCKLVGAKRLGLLGEGEEAIGLRDAERHRSLRVGNVW